MQRIWGGERVARETRVDGGPLQVRGDGAGKGYLRTPSLGEGDELSPGHRVGHGDGEALLPPTSVGEPH